MAWLEARNVCKYFREGSKYEVRALRDVTLAIPEGSFVLLKGPSGSEKSTLLAILGALENPTRGQVIFRDRDMAAFSDSALARVRRQMGFVFQNFSLIPRLSVLENITYALLPRGIPRVQRNEIAQSMLSRFGLGERSADRPEELRKASTTVHCCF